jgi:hypothetical protein
VERYLIDSDTSPDRLVAQGIEWLVREAFVTGVAGAVLVPEAQSIPNLSAGVGKPLSKSDRQLFRDGLDLGIITARQQPSSFDGPVLVVWANSEMMAKAEHMQPSAICATGWEAGGLADWVRVWGATDPQTCKTFPREQPAPVLLGAVASMSLDVLHPLDKARAVNALRALKLCDRKIDPAMISAVALDRGWQSRAADRLHELAEKFALGKPVQGGSKLTKTKAKEMVAGYEQPVPLP